MAIISKAFIKSIILTASGLKAYRWSTLKNGLYCFNYHRIGDSSKTQYDPNVYSCSSVNFDKQLSFYKKHFKVINESQAIELINNNKIYDNKYALITFDDGYVDNYKLALPVLLKHELSATFYIPTDYIESDIVPWWDEIAWLVKNSQISTLEWADNDIPLRQFSIDKTIRLVLNAIKSDDRMMDVKITELEQKLGCSLDKSNLQESLFVTWHDIQDMVSQGMSIGSHTCSHRILSHLTPKEQAFEMNESKKVLEDKIGQKVNSIAYPVGQRNCFTEQTCSIAKESDYKLGFSFINGFNDSPAEDDLFQLKRIGIDGNPSIALIKQKVCF
jgi:peptidoglycan/xylan/chitin deacetylase (PgdA/CDA1 family)